MFEFLSYMHTFEGMQNGKDGMNTDANKYIAI